MTKIRIHLIGNAHLDPVWLWDWREGLSEGLTTVRTMLDLMDERPEMTFVRGESVIYRHVEETEPETFERIRKAFEAGRWDIVGGNVIQPDTNLPCTEALLRQFQHGKAYFQDRFGFDVKAAWAADSFGHPAGLPDILAESGFKYFAFTRPPKNVLPIDKAAFWWEGCGGASVLAYRPSQLWYGAERDAIAQTLNDSLEEAHRSGLHNVGCFYGLGNHGGGPTRRHLDEIRQWAEQHPEVEVVHSGLHRMFGEIENEVMALGDATLPTVKGELGYALRGCYASSARFKFLYRKAEAQLLRAEQADRVIAQALDIPNADLEEAWDGLLFNAFHDILPGTSIERAMDEQVEWVGGVLHGARKAEFAAINALVRQIDSTVQPPAEPDMPCGVPVLVFNPHATDYVGPIELEAGLDYRPLFTYENRPDEVPVRLLGPGGEPIPFQVVATEHDFYRPIPWRKRVVFPATIPAGGWRVYELAWDEGAPSALPPQGIQPATSSSPGVIDNGIYQVQAEVDTEGIRILRNGLSLFEAPGLQAVVYSDPWGTWGGLFEQPESLDISMVIERWDVKQIIPIESGPHRARFLVKLGGESDRSRLELTISLFAGRDAVDVSARVIWNERNARLKLVLPCGERARFDVPGGVVERGPRGEVPGGRWVHVLADQGPGVALITDALYGFDCKDGALRATICRATRYAAEAPEPEDEINCRPPMDTGELKFNFVIAPGDSDLPALARQLEQPLIVQNISPSPGRLGKAGSFPV